MSNNDFIANECHREHAERSSSPPGITGAASRLGGTGVETASALNPITALIHIVPVTDPFTAALASVVPSGTPNEDSPLKAIKEAKSSLPIAVLRPQLLTVARSLCWQAGRL